MRFNSQLVWVYFLCLIFDLFNWENNMFIYSEDFKKMENLFFFIFVIYYFIWVDVKNLLNIFFILEEWRMVFEKVREEVNCFYVKNFS